MTTRVSQVALRKGVAPALALALVAGVWLTGCSEDRDETAAVEVPCSIAIDAVDDIGSSYRTHGSGGGFVALPSGTLQLGREGSAGSEFEGFRFAKFGLLVRRDRTVSLEVVDSPGRAVLEYVHPDTPASVVGVGPCSSEREWVVFAGGVWATEPGCVELLVASGDERLGVRLPVGAPCDGAP